MNHIENYIIVAILLVLMGSIIFYLVRSGKKGKSCIGCSCGGNCGGKCSCNTGTKKASLPDKQVSQKENTEKDL